MNEAFPEGSKQFLLNPADSIFSCQLNVYHTNSGLGSIMNCPEFKRIYIHISDPSTEKIDIGFRNNTANRFFRIFNPNGTLLVPGTAIPNTGAAPGRIEYAIQNIQGPSNTLVTGGYSPLVYTPTVAGDYWIEFNRDNNFVTPTFVNFGLALWDITVVKTTNSPFTPIDGRVYCKNWNLFTGNTDPMRAITYAYTNDSIIHRIDFNGMAGANFTLSMNSFGVTNSGSVANNRRSVSGDASVVDTIGEYKLFFNLPDTDYFRLTQTPLDINFATEPITGCTSPTLNISQCIQVVSTKSGVVDLLINLNGVAGYQPGTADVLIPYNVVPGSNCLPWDGMNGLGQYVPMGTPLDLSVTIQVGITHIPLYDVEDNTNGFIVQCILPSTIANTPDLYYDDFNLGGGSNFTGCTSPCHTWGNAVGNTNTLNTWFFGTYISKATTIPTLSYAPEFSITSVNPDCQHNLANGSISYSNISPYSFQVNDSIGIFQAPLTSPASYSLVTMPHIFTGMAEGTYTIIIKNAQGCSYTQTVTLTAVGLPTTSVAGPAQNICLPSTSVTMAGNAPTTGTGNWSQLSGPAGASITNPGSHNSTITNLTPGTYVFEWAITSGICPPSTSDVIVTVFAAPTVPLIASNSPVCEGDTINLAASATIGSSFSWTGPGSYTSISQNPVILNATSLMSGTYTVTATLGTCTPLQANTTVTVNPLPAMPNASGNSPLCSGNTIHLTTPAASGSSYSWTGPNNFNSTNQNPNITNSTVAMSGIYSLAITNQNTGCTSLSDTVNIVVNPTPVLPTITSNSPLCVGDDLTLNAGSTTNSVYNWTGPSGFVSSLQNNTINDAALNQAGTYSVIATLGNCPSTAATVNVIVNPLPATPGGLSNSPVCVGDTILLSTATLNGFTYDWTGPAGFNAAFQNPGILNATIAMAGNYNLTITNTTTGCTSLADTVNVVVNSLPITPVAASNTPVCTGDTISLTTTATGGLSYQWTGPGSYSSSIQNPIITNATLAMAGTYSLVVTDNTTSCISLAGNTVVVINQTPAQPTLTSNSPVCAGEDLDLQAVSNAGSTYNWNGPGNFSSSVQNPVLSNVTISQAGTYSAIATLLGCNSLQANIIVTVNALPATPTATSNSPICAGDTLSLNTLIGGVTYSWTGPNGFSSSDQSPVILNATVNESGNYNLTVSDIATGCTSLSDTIAVTVNIKPALPAITNNSPVCQGSTLTLSAGSNPNSTFAWTGPNNFNSTDQDPLVNNITLSDSGTYYVVATLGICQSDTASATIIVNALPATPVANNNSAICQGDTLKLITPTVSGFSYLWTGPSSFSSNLQNPTIDSTSLNNAGQYSLEITDSITGCTSLAGITLAIINPLPATPVATSNSALCTGDTMHLYSDTLTNVIYSWTGPLGFVSGDQNPVVINSTIPMTGDYIINVTDNTTGCKSLSDTTFMIVNVLPAILSVSNTSPACEGSTVDLAVTSVLGANYHWSGPASFTSSVQNPSLTSVLSSNAGSYDVFATLGTCTSSIYSTSVTVNLLPATPVAASNSAVCENDTLLLSTTQLNGFNYLWTGPNGFSSPLQNPQINNSLLTDAGNYILSVTDTTTGCTSFNDTIQVVINAIPVIANVSSNSPVCAGNSINLNSNTTAGVNFQWTGPNGYTSNVQNPVITNSTTAMTGTYSLIISDNNTGCTGLAANTSVTVNQTPLAPTATSNSPVCAGQALNLQSSSDPGSAYSWTGPGNYSSADQNPVISNAQPAQSGTYSVTATIGTCTSQPSTIGIVVNALPDTPDISSNSPLCENNALNLNTPNANGVNFEWTGPNNFSTSLQNPTISDATIAISGIYSLTLTDINTGCKSLSASSNIIVNGLPQSPELTINSQLCYGDTLNLATSTNASIYSWTGPNGFISDLQNPGINDVSDNMEGIYILTITDINGCSSKDSLIMEINCPDISEIFVPNVFTPNGDNTNDLFMIVPKDLKEMQGEIYDRWGIKVFSWNSLKDGWNGKNKGGQDVPEGTYYYIINAVSYHDKTIVQKGSLTLFR